MARKRKSAREVHRLRRMGEARAAWDRAREKGFDAKSLKRVRRILSKGGQSVSPNMPHPRGGS